MRLLENLRSQLTWLDLLPGLLAAAAIAGVLIGFRYQSVPTYKVGEIAAQDIRAHQDVLFADPIETEKRREAVRSTIPVVYDHDTRRVAQLDRRIGSLFESGRRLLAARHTPRSEGVSREEARELARELAKESEETFPEDVLLVLIRHRFAVALEAQIVRVIQNVLRPGIFADRAAILRDQKGAVVLRDVATGLEQRLSEAYPVRDVAAAREYLRQFGLEFSDLSAADRRSIFQFLEGMVAPDVTMNPALTQARREANAASVLPFEQLIKKGKTIVRAGDEITPSIAAQLFALKAQRGTKSLLTQFFGFFVVALVLVYALWRYFVHYQSRHRKIRNHTLLVLLVMVSQLGVVRLFTALADILSERVSLDSFRDPTHLYYAIPFACGAVLVTLLVDTNVGIYSAMALASLVGLYYGDANPAAYAVLGSLAGIYSIRQYKDRAAILKAGITIGCVNALAVLGISLVRQAPVEISNLQMAIVSGILSSALASMVLPALESIFKITTDIRLLELSNLNAPILRRLSVEAPGTYHHSLMVGTLAEAAAEAIGANPLLVRVAAYYHDVGKMLKPEYFVENQLYGINKHEKLSPSMSCLIIASHVKDGLELAKEIGLAERIRDMIPQHHGTRIMTYFYQKAKDALGPHEVVETDYRYPGPKPQTKEAAIMMMADSVEAASRTLTNPTSAQIQGMINRLVDAIVADNQFVECDITLREIQLVKDSFFSILSGIYHRRIDYPGYDFKQTEPVPAQQESLQGTGPKPANAL
jgi:putative nucleotidyltransferase with HDIG domain